MISKKVFSKGIAVSLYDIKAGVNEPLNRKSNISDDTEDTGNVIPLRYRFGAHSADSDSTLPSDIEQGQAVEKPITIYDIAKELNISATTVNKALNGNDKISKKTAEKVFKIASNLGYVPNLLARNLRESKNTDDKEIGQQKVTIYDIAKELNISASTVSRCFKESCSANPATRRMVLKKAKKMGFVLHTEASQLRSKNNYIIGVFISTPGNQNSIDLFSGIEKTAKEYGFNILIGNITDCSAGTARALKKIIIQHTDGLLFVAPNPPDSDCFARKEKFKKPVVFLNSTQILIPDDKKFAKQTQSEQQIVLASTATSQLFNQIINQPDKIGFNRALVG